jgi:hypothetical protein
LIGTFFPLIAVGKKHKAGSSGVRHLPSLRMGMSRTDAGLLAIVVI